MCVCVCVCVWEERGEGGREREGEGGGVKRGGREERGSGEINTEYSHIGVVWYIYRKRGSVVTYYRGQITSTRLVCHLISKVSYIHTFR